MVELKTVLSHTFFKHVFVMCCHVFVYIG